MRKEKGNALLEMMVFTPLALLFLFVGIDSGLYFIERASTRDAVRSGTNIELQTSRAGSVFEVSSSGKLVLNEERAREVVHRTASEIFNNMLAVKGIENISQHEVGLQVRAAAVELVVNESSGEIESFRAFGSIQLPDRGARSSALGSHGKSYPLLNIDTFVKKELENRSKDVPYFAIPRIPSLNQPDINSHRFLSKSFAVYAEVQSAPRGVNGRFLRSTLGRDFCIQHQQLTMLRMPLG